MSRSWFLQLWMGKVGTPPGASGISQGFLQELDFHWEVQLGNIFQWSIKTVDFSFERHVWEEAESGEEMQWVKGREKERQSGERRAFSWAELVCFGRESCWAGQHPVCESTDWQQASGLTVCVSEECVCVSLTSYLIASPNKPAVAQPAESAITRIHPPLIRSFFNCILIETRACRSTTFY